MKVVPACKWIARWLLTALFIVLVTFTAASVRFYLRIGMDRSSTYIAHGVVDVTWTDSTKLAESPDWRRAHPAGLEVHSISAGYQWLVTPSSNTGYIDRSLPPFKHVRLPLYLLILPVALLTAVMWWAACPILVDRSRRLRDLQRAACRRRGRLVVCTTLLLLTTCVTLISSVVYFHVGSGNAFFYVTRGLVCLDWTNSPALLQSAQWCNTHPAGVGIHLVALQYDFSLLPSADALQYTPSIETAFEHVEMPLYLLVIPFASLTAWLWYRNQRRSRRGQCSECGYDLTGNTSGVCPECGNACETTTDTEPTVDA